MTSRRLILPGLITPIRTNGRSEREAFLRASERRLKKVESRSSCSKPAPVDEGYREHPEGEPHEPRRVGDPLLRLLRARPEHYRLLERREGLANRDEARGSAVETLESASGRLTPALLSSARSCSSVAHLLLPLPDLHAEPPGAQEPDRRDAGAVSRGRPVMGMTPTRYREVETDQEARIRSRDAGPGVALCRTGCAASMRASRRHGEDSEEPEGEGEDLGGREARDRGGDHLEAHGEERQDHQGDLRQRPDRLGEPLPPRLQSAPPAVRPPLPRTR